MQTNSKGAIFHGKKTGESFLGFVFLVFFFTDCTMGFITTIKPPFGIYIYIFKYIYILYTFFGTLFRHQPFKSKFLYDDTYVP